MARTAAASLAFVLSVLPALAGVCVAACLPAAAAPQVTDEAAPCPSHGSGSSTGEPAPATDDCDHGHDGGAMLRAGAESPRPTLEASLTLGPSGRALPDPEAVSFPEGGGDAVPAHVRTALSNPPLRI